MDKWKKALIPLDLEIQKVLELIDINSQQIAIVIDEEGKLLGTVTDGDIRRGILKGISLDSPVSQIMNPNPISIPKLEDRNSIIKILNANKVRHLPVVDDQRRVIGVERLDELISNPLNDSWVVIMAGGLGTRLRPLTNDCPKPMIKIGGKPVIQTALEQFISQGFGKFCITVNYKSEQIKDYFGDGSKFGVEIRYIDEEKLMGTAGSLRLLPFKTDEPILVVNGDILTKLSFDAMVKFHKKHQSKATIAVTTYDYQVPYGVIKANKSHLVGFEEKPVYSSFINAGIYVLNPEVIDYVPDNSCFDINSLFEILLQKEELVCIFPIREYWIDIGNMESFRKACENYDIEFK